MPTHLAYIFTTVHITVHRDTYTVKISNKSSCLDNNSWKRGRLWREELGLQFPQSPVSLIVIETCTHIRERGYLLLHFRDYLLSHVFEAIWQILKGKSQIFQSQKQKTSENIFWKIVSWKYWHFVFYPLLLAL